jgi:hypothetical protein
VFTEANFIEFVLIKISNKYAFRLNFLQTMTKHIFQRQFAAEKTARVMRGCNVSYPNVLGGVQGATTGFPIHPNLFSWSASPLRGLLDRTQRLGRNGVLPRLASDVLGRMFQTEKKNSLRTKNIITKIGRPNKKIIACVMIIAIILRIKRFPKQL